MKIGFDHNRYTRMQSERILQRIDEFGGKLYLELGGKLFDDYHASRVLPGFLPEAQADSTALAALVDLLSHSVAPSPDTLALSPADRRVILFADGTWALVDSLGGLSVPDAKERLVLAEGGSWRAVTPSTVKIPILKESTAEPKQSTAATTQTGDGVYHTIVSGDTLSGLARRYGTTVRRLCELNGITETSTLRLGKKLRVK